MCQPEASQCDNEWHMGASSFKKLDFSPRSEWGWLLEPRSRPHSRHFSNPVTSQALACSFPTGK